MRKNKKIKWMGSILLLVLLFFVLTPSSQNALLFPKDPVQTLVYSSSGFSDSPPYVSGQILVKFKPTLKGKNIEFILSAYHTKKIQKIPVLDVYQLQIPEWMTVEETVNAFNQSPTVEYAQPNYIYQLHKTPNDPLFPEQYALYNSGQQIGSIPGSPQGTPSADIKATAAWEETLGSEEIVIAIIDSGVSLDHSDLKNKIFSHGRDFINNDYDASDDYWHGTLVAGIAAAETDNKIGIAGVAWNCKILPVKVFNNTGEGGTSDIISQGIIWAADNDADVLNLSFGSSGYDQVLLNAIKYAYDKDIVIVASAGNENTAVSYPAAFDSYCLAVAATDYNDLRCGFSNYGTQIDVAAPGEMIYSTVPPQLDPTRSPYAYGIGTSFSAPHVAGLAALIKSIKPWLKPSEIMDIIRYSADDTNASLYKGKDYYIGYGRINMEKALVPIKIK
ncbi:MAG: S8 family peptidase [Candidatus Aminicenantales bacterium]